MSKQATKLEKEKRLLAVQSWIIDGAQDDFIRRQIKTQWGLSTRQTQRYIKQAYDQWKQDANIEMESKRAAKIAELKQLRRDLKEEYKGTPAGINAIIRIEKLIIRLEGMEPPRQHEIKAEVEVQPTMTPEEREAKIAEFKKRLNEPDR